MKVEDGEFKTADMGMGCKDGNLYCFAIDAVYVMKMTPHGPRAWRKTREVPRFVPCLIPTVFETGGAIWAARGDKEGKDDFGWRARVVGEFIRDNVPREIIPLMASYGMNSWLVCSLAMRVPGGMELARRNPGLAYIVAANNVFMKKVAKPWRRARSLLRMKRRDVAGLAGFPATESTVRILSKMDPRELSPKLLFRLRWLLNLGDDFVTSALRHVPQVDTFILETLFYEPRRDVVGIGFLSESAKEKKERGVFDSWSVGQRLLRDTFALAEMLRVPMPARRRFNSVEELRRYHDRLVDFNAARPDHLSTGRIRNVEFPRPGPVPDFESEACGITLILDAKGLSEWGRRQRNCVGSYAQRVVSGQMFVYAIEGEEEATLSLTRPLYSPHWRVDELAGYRNAPVSDGLRRLVANWVAEAAGKLVEEGRCSRAWMPLEDFPFPEVDLGWLRARPSAGETRIGYPVREELILGEGAEWETRDELVEGAGDVFCYEVMAPVEGYAMIRKCPRGWRVAFSESGDGMAPLPKDVIDALNYWLLLEVFGLSETPPVEEDVSAGIAPISWQNAPSDLAGRLRLTLERRLAATLDSPEEEFIYRYDVGTESGWFALREIRGQWEAVWSLADDGETLSERDIAVIDDWLWRRTPEGGWRQGRLDFFGENAADNAVAV